MLQPFLPFENKKSTKKPQDLSGPGGCLFEEIQIL
jgi:hypothetical protein